MARVLLAGIHPVQNRMNARKQNTYHALLISDYLIAVSKLTRSIACDVDLHCRVSHRSSATRCFRTSVHKNYRTCELYSVLHGYYLGPSPSSTPSLEEFYQGLWA